MMHVWAWASIRFHQIDERTRFILRHGVLPWGIAVGVIATGVIFGTPLRPPLQGGRSDPLGLVFLAFLCLAEWSIVGGWLIGAVLWTLQPRPKGPRPDRAEKDPSSEERAS